MCLILFAKEFHPEYQLILAANRDEYYERPAAPLSYWDDIPSVLGGRDLKSLGTWLGVNRRGALAAITNVRDPGSLKPDAPSRGILVKNFLVEDMHPEMYLKDVRKIGKQYNGFNLLVAKEKDLYYYSNKQDNIQKIGPGIYGLSNDSLDTPWPKVAKGKKMLKKVLSRKDIIDPETIFNILADKFYAPDHLLPDTGVGDVFERVLSPLFITSKIYGTRCSSIILMEKTGRIRFYERSFDMVGQKVEERETICYELET